MSLLISARPPIGQTALSKHDAIARDERATPPPFTRSAEPSANDAVGHARNRPVQRNQNFTNAQLQSMGREILSLYKHKVLDKGGRELAFSSGGSKYTIRGLDIKNILIHGPAGIIQLAADGTPKSNRAVPVTSREGGTKAMMRVLATMRHYKP
jgi:hypothetical protein